MATIPIKKLHLKKMLESVNVAKITDFCHRNHILSLKLFGSILTDDFTDSSDVDVLIEFDPNFIPGYFRYVELEFQLSEFFNNRKVDLRTKHELSKSFRNRVLNEAVDIYG